MWTFIVTAAAIVLAGATGPETRIAVTLPIVSAKDAGGRLLVFAEPATPANASADTIDAGGLDTERLSVAGRDVTTFASGRSVTINTDETAFPTGFSGFPPGDYRVQVVLDPDRSYNRTGRGAGDIVSKVVTVRFPLVSIPVIGLDHVIPPEPGQFDVVGLPRKAAEQINASRAHLHDERIASPLLTDFRGAGETVAAWVLTPPGYDPEARRTYPTVFTAGGFGATHKSNGQQLSRQWHLMETGEIPPMIWVALDFGTSTGTTEFADSANNGPWGQTFVSEVIPALEARYRMDAKPSGRFLTGHSSGGWFALWSQVRYPKFFGGSWATSPDPVSFNDFIGVDLCARGANLYRDPAGHVRPMERDHGEVLQTIEQAATMEAVLGRDGGQLRSFEWVFSPRRADGSLTPLFDRRSGAIDPVVADYWREHYDIAHLVETSGAKTRKQLNGKLHVTVGAIDSFYLDGSVHKLEATLLKAGVVADFTYVAEASHSMAQVYASGGDRNSLWKSMSSAMYSIARPRQAVTK
jgi:S-formylglutathione hydrolase FrmB